jgi:DNA-binding HxlR family transcriptional regulator
VTRTVYPTIPPKVEYALTDLGKTLLEPITALAEWARGNGVAMQRARARYDGQGEPAGRGAHGEATAGAESPGAE